MKHKLLDKHKLSLILVFASLIAVIIFGYIVAPDTYKNSGDNIDSNGFMEDDSDNNDWFEDDWSDDQDSQVDDKKDTGDKTIIWENGDSSKKTTSSSKTTGTTKKSTTTTTNKSSSSSTTKKPSTSTTTKKPSSSGSTVNNTTKPTEPEENNNQDPGTTPVPEDTMKWPDNSYTNLVPKPSRGTVQQSELKDGIFCILMSGADMVDAKSYAASLINAGYTSDITETIENDNYLFGGGNATGSFVVISYKSGQFIIGIEK